MFRDWGRWTTWMHRLAETTGDEAKHWHTYEAGWKAVLDWDDDAVQSAVDGMTSDAPVWRMRRAALKSTLFSHRDAALDYEAALLSIRQKLRSAPQSAWLISLEGWASLFHRVLYNALFDDFAGFAEEDTEETQLRYTGAKADPWNEISRRERLVTERTERNRSDNQEWALSFEPGCYRAGGERRLAAEDECPFYGLLELMERTGAPERSAYFNLFSDRLVAAYLALKDPKENDLMTFLARYRGVDVRVLDRILPRMRVALLSEDAVQFLLDRIVKRIDRMLSTFGKPRHGDHVRFLLALLARIVIRTDEEKAIEIYRWCFSVLNNPGLWWTCNVECGKVLSAAISVMGSDRRKEALPLAIELALPAEAKAKGIEREWPELVDDFSTDDLNGLVMTPTLMGRIDTLIRLAANFDRLDRTRALRRLLRLYRAAKLTADQTSQLETAIWSRCSGKGWPVNHELHPWVFLDLPGQESAQRAFEASFIEPLSTGEVTEYTLLNVRAGLPKLNKQPSPEMLWACVETCVNWRPKPKGKKDSGFALFHGLDPDLETAKEIGFTLAQALLPRIHAAAEDDRVSSLVAELVSLDHIPNLAAIAFQIHRLDPASREKAIDSIRSAIASRDPVRVYPAFTAIQQFVENADEKMPTPPAIVEILLQVLEQRLQPGLATAMQLVRKVLEADWDQQVCRGRLCRVLPSILEEYRYDQNRLDIPSMAELPLVRRQVLQLGMVLKRDGLKLDASLLQLENDPLPEVKGR